MTAPLLKWSLPLELRPLVPGFALAEDKKAQAQ